MRPFLTLLLLLAPAAAARASNLPPQDTPMLGRTAPHFQLPRLTDGEVALGDLLGRPTVLVVGTTIGAAPACKEWMLALQTNLRRRPVHVLQVAVLDNPWYLPRPAVRSRIKDFVPPDGYGQVLLEWGVRFGQDYGIKRDDVPRVFVLDPKGVIRHAAAARMDDESLVAVLSLLNGL